MSLSSVGSASSLFDSVSPPPLAQWVLEDEAQREVEGDLDAQQAFCSEESSISEAVEKTPPLLQEGPSLGEIPCGSYLLQSPSDEVLGQGVNFAVESQSWGADSRNQESLP